MSRTVIGLAAVVLIGLGALWYLVLRDDPAPASTTTAPTVATTQSTGPAPSLPTAGTPTTLHSTGRPRVAPDMTGMESRDHRDPDLHGSSEVGSGGSGSAGPPPPHVPPTLARVLYHNASATVLACARKIDKADRGGSPHLGAKLKVAIKDGTIHIVDATPEAVDLGGPAVEDAKKCVHDYFVNIELPTNDDSADLDGADLSLSYAVH